MTYGMSGAAQRPTTGPEPTVTCPEVLHDTSTAGPLRIEPCLCGGTITAPRDDPAPWVRVHNDGHVHMAWRGRNGL